MNMKTKNYQLGRRAGKPAIYNQNGAEIAEMLEALNDDWQDDAKLICAAPELLQHLKILVFGIQSGVAIPPDGAAVNAALQAIAKAEGNA